MRRYNIVLCVGLIICGLAFAIISLCGKKYSNQKIVLDFNNIEIWYPHNFSTYNKKVFYTSSPQAYRLFVYFDSLTCTPCMLKHTYKWAHVADKISEEKKRPVIPVLVFALKYNNLKKMKFEYYNSMPFIPIIIDKENAFINENKWILENGLISKLLLINDKGLLEAIY